MSKVLSLTLAYEDVITFVCGCKEKSVKMIDEMIDRRANATLEKLYLTN